MEQLIFDNLTPVLLDVFQFLATLNPMLPFANRANLVVRSAFPLTIALIAYRVNT